MVDCLKDMCIPKLRKVGFKGSFPHFYRVVGSHVDLVNFQFYSGGGSFCINLGFADPPRQNVYFQSETEPRKLRVAQTRERLRLGSIGGKDSWFSFGSAEDSRQPVRWIGMKVVELFESQAEQWWADMRQRNES